MDLLNENTKFDLGSNYEDVVIFRNQDVTLKYAMDNCKPGETIEGPHFSLFPLMLEILCKERKQDLRYVTDDKYGKPRFILATNGDQKRINAKSTDSKYKLELPTQVKPISLPLKELITI